MSHMGPLLFTRQSISVLCRMFPCAEALMGPLTRIFGGVKYNMNIHGSKMFLDLFTAFVLPPGAPPVSYGATVDGDDMRALVAYLYGQDVPFENVIKQSDGQQYRALWDVVQPDRATCVDVMDREPTTKWPLRTPIFIPYNDVWLQVNAPGAFKPLTQSTNKHVSDELLILPLEGNVYLPVVVPPTDSVPWEEGVAEESIDLICNETDVFTKHESDGSDASATSHVDRPSVEGVACQAECPSVNDVACQTECPSVNDVACQTECLSVEDTACPPVEDVAKDAPCKRTMAAHFDDENATGPTSRKKKCKVYHVPSGCVMNVTSTGLLHDGPGPEVPLDDPLRFAQVLHSWLIEQGIDV